MGRRAAAGRSDRGGESIPTLRTLRLRLATAGLAVALAAILASYPIAVAGSLAPGVAALAALALASVLIATVVHGRMIGTALVLIGAEYAIVDAKGDVDAATVIAYAVGLIVIAELLLMLWTTPSGALVDRDLIRHRAVGLSSKAGASALLALVVLAASSLQLPAALGAALLGSTAAVILLLLPLLLLRRPDRTGSTPG